MPRAGRHPSPPYLAYGALALLFAAAVTFQYRDARERFERFYRVDRPRLPFSWEFAGNRIDSVEREAELAGIKVGDHVVSVNGRPFRGVSDILAPLRKAKTGDVMVLGTRSTPFGTAEKVAAITLAPEAYSEIDFAPDSVSFLTYSLGIPIVCLALGFFVAIVRPHDPQAWMLLLLLLSFMRFGSLTSIALWGYEDWLQPIGTVYLASAEIAWPIAMTLVGIYFGERLPFDRRFPWAKWLLLGPLLVIAVSHAAFMFLMAHHWEAAASLATWMPPYYGPGYIFFLAGVVVFFAGLGYKAFTASNPDARRRLKLLLFGTLASVVPALLFFVGSLVTGRDTFEPGVPTWILGSVLAMLLLFPATFAYVIVVQKALDVRVVIRQGVQYLLASGTVRALQVLLTFVAILGAALLAAEDVKRPQRVQMVALGLAGVVVIQRVAQKLRGWVDRRFFREAYDAEQILSDLADKVRTFVETRPLLETVATRISESLHVPRVALLLQSGQAFQPAYALGYTEPPQIQIPEQSATADHLRRERHARVYPEDDSSWIYQPEISEQERSAIRTLQSQLLLPLSLNQKLLGILSLGPKQSEEPYSKGDLRLLDSVATQTGLAVENSQLAAAVAAEVAQRERMNRELEIAREVQERLFPQECPPIDGLDYAGSCRPALGVGGDYYDFIPLSATELGIAIGDVSGKGIPAALLMASLRASLRGQTIRRDDTLAHMIATLNQLVYESSSSNRYATFFYGEYDAASRRLTYVNAGHNPPMVLRKGREVIRLDAGGPVVGLFPACRYEQATCNLQAGDVFLAFTDGISEAMNADDEEWGEDRLIACAGRVNGCAREGIEQIMAAADAFVAGARQHDDMTIILARVSEQAARRTPNSAITERTNREAGPLSPLP